MKLLIATTLAALFSATLVSSVFAQCSHGYKSAGLSKMTIAAEKQKPEEAMSTYDPAIVDSLVNVKKLTDDTKTSD